MDLNSCQITAAERSHPPQPGDVLWPEVGIASPPVRIPQTESLPNEDDLENARGNTESGVSGAGVRHSCAIHSPKSSPECRSAYLRNERSPSPEYPWGRETLLDLPENAKPLVPPDFVSGSQYPAIRTTAG